MFDEDFYLSKISGVLLRHNKLIFGEFSGIVDDGTEYEAEYKITDAFYNKNEKIYTVNINENIIIKFTKENDKIKYKYIKNW